MAYGANRTAVVTEPFDASIPATFGNGDGDFGTCTWVTGGHVGPTNADADGSLTYTNSTPAANQYTTLVVNVLSAASENNVSADCRCQAAADERRYSGNVSSSGGYPKYRIVEWTGGTANTELATAGTQAALAANDTITLEAESTTLRLGTSESGGADTQRVTTTDNTLATGTWGSLQYAASAVAQNRYTTFIGGEITAGGATIYNRAVLRSPIFSSRVVK